VLFQHFICNVWILCHIIFFLLFPFLLFVMFVMFGCYIKEKKKKTKKWGRGVNIEEEMREKK
jgi:heme/copper-type cytochrome/quinol oxidase subunit 2